MPVAKLVAIASVNGERPLGAMEGQIYMADDFDAPLPDDLFALFNGKELKRKKPTRAKLENRTKSPRPAMRFLLDTSTWLWSVAKVDRLNQVAEDVLRDPQHELYLSAVSVWEIAIKASLGKLHLPEAPRLVIPRETARQGLRSLPVTYLHALGVYDLPLHHGDPFDRLLVAQALSEGLTLITANRELKRYSLKILWAGR